MLMPTDIKDEVRAVLNGIQKDSKYGRSYLTAYQILEKLQKRDQIIKERGMPGQGGGNYYAAANVVSDAAKMLDPDIDIKFLDTSSLKIMLKDGTNIVTPGNPNVGLYRLKK